MITPAQLQESVVSLNKTCKEFEENPKVETLIETEDPKETVKSNEDFEKSSEIATEWNCKLVRWENLNCEKLSA